MKRLPLAGGPVEVQLAGCSQPKQIGAFSYPQAHQKHRRFLGAYLSRLLNRHTAWAAPSLWRRPSAATPATTPLHALGYTFGTK